MCSSFQPPPASTEKDSPPQDPAELEVDDPQFPHDWRKLFL